MDNTEARSDAMVLEFKEDRPLTEVSLSLCHLRIKVHLTERDISAHVNKDSM